MKKFTNTRNPILPLEYHIPDSEGHVMPDGKLYILRRSIPGSTGAIRLRLSGRCWSRLRLTEKI